MKDRKVSQRFPSIFVSNGERMASNSMSIAAMTELQTINDDDGTFQRFSSIQSVPILDLNQSEFGQRWISGCGGIEQRHADFVSSDFEYRPATVF